MASPHPRFRVALLGYGIAGRFFHAPLIAATPGLELRYIVTADPGRTADAQARYPDVIVLPDADSVWARADDVDLVVVATPNRTHVPLAMQALAAGRPVVVDKPLAASADEGQALVDAAAERGVLLTVFQNRRWDADLLTLQRLLRDGALGTVFRFESRFERWRPVPKPGWRESGTPGDAGGLLFDLGSHLVDQALLLFGPLALDQPDGGPHRAVYAEVDRRRPGVQTDDDTFLALTHANGVRSHLWVSAVAGSLGPRLRVLGERGAFTVYGLDPQEGELRAGRTPDDPGFGTIPEQHWGTLAAGDDAHRVPAERGNYLAFYEALVESLRTGAPPPVDPEDAVRVLRILELARDRGTPDRPR